MQYEGKLTEIISGVLLIVFVVFFITALIVSTGVVYSTVDMDAVEKQDELHDHPSIAIDGGF